MNKNFTPEGNRQKPRLYDQTAPYANGFGASAKKGLNNASRSLPIIEGRLVGEKTKLTKMQKIGLGVLAIAIFTASTDTAKQVVGKGVNLIPAAEPHYTHDELSKMPKKVISRDRPGMFAEEIASIADPAVFDGHHREEANEVIDYVQGFLEHDNPRSVEVPVLPEQIAYDKKHNPNS